MTGQDGQGYAARFFGGEVPVGEDAEVRVTAGTLVIRTGAATFEWPLDDVRQTRGEIRGEPVHLERSGSNAVVVFRDGAVLDALIAVRPGFARRLRRPRAPFGARTVALVVAGILVVAGVFRLGIPALAGTLARVVPVEWEERFGGHVVEQLESGAHRRVTDPRVTGPVDRIVARLAAARPESPYRYRVLVLEGTDVNALAAPGGWIVVFEGLLRFAESPEALAGVLAHEMEHVDARHVTEGMIANASLGFLLSVTLGDAGGASIGRMAGVLGQMSFSREAEREADEGGLRRLVAADIAPDALPGFLERMHGKQNVQGWASFLSTHPAPLDRAKRLRAAVAGSAARSYRPVLTSEDWTALQAAIQRPDP